MDNKSLNNIGYYKYLNMSELIVECVREYPITKEIIETYLTTNSRINVEYMKEHKDKVIAIKSVLGSKPTKKIVRLADLEEENRLVEKKEAATQKVYELLNKGNIAIDVVKNNIRLPDDKYYGINFLHINNPKETQRLEFRYIGGKDYEKNIGQIIYFLDRFIIVPEGKLEAKHILLLEKLIKHNDPSEINVVMNEFAFQITQRTGNLDKALYWLNWILEWEKINSKKYGKYECSSRSEIGRAHV